MDTFKEVLAQALKDKKKKKTDTGETPDQVVVNPVKDDRKQMAYTNEQKVPESALDEAVVSFGARIKRAQNMRKYRARLMRGRKLAQAKLASNSRLKAKTQNLARRVVKKQVTGARGWEYQKLSPADKIAIDKMVDRKLAAVKRVATRLAPKVRQAEVKRYASRTAGKMGRGTLSYVKP